MQTEITEQQIELLEESFAMVAGRAEELVETFYANLFANFPSVVPIFDGVDLHKQQAMLLGALTFTMENIRDGDTLVPALKEMGKRHQGYGATKKHYLPVKQTLLGVLMEMAGDAWNDSYTDAWETALDFISECMLEGYEDQEDGTMSEATENNVNDEVARLKQDMAELESRYDAEMGKINALNKVQAIIEFNLDGSIITANQNFLDAVGYSLEEIQGKHHSMFVSPEYRASNEYRQFWDTLNRGEFVEGQFPRIRKDGSELWINATYNPVMDADGKVYKVVKFAQDGTEMRKQQMAATSMRSAMDGAEANFMMCDENLNINYCNPAVLEMLRKRQGKLRSIWPGLNLDKMVGENIDQFHENPAHQRHILSDLQNLPAKAEITVGDLEFDLNATAIIDEEGNYKGNMIEWKDITEQKTAERQIENLIDAASKGELDERLDESQFSGFMHALAVSINRMMDAVVVPIKETTAVLETLSEGNLTNSMDGEFDGQFQIMQTAVNTSIGNLLNMVNEIRTSADSMNTSANEIAQGNLNLSQRTEEQASSLEETASSIEELTGTVKQNADNAQQANQLASGARSEAEKGGSVVKNAIEAMGEINQASKKIADIIGVIDEIAFQTNLLALNAAVEAARAGEQGRGFAVVAAEVRNLAQRSAGAAKEIKTLINDSVQKVDEGSKLVDESGETLEEIVNSVKKVSDIIAEIAAASTEQSAGIDEINKAVAQMDEMTQQNAALVEEAASASKSMDEQAKGLTELMNYFETDGQGHSQSMQVERRNATEERRSKERPWTNDAKAPSVKAPAAKAPAKDAKAEVMCKAGQAKAKAASGGGADSEWEEF